jgi:hypothetical protein
MSFCDLPTDIVLLVIHYLATADLAALCCTCKSVYALVRAFGGGGFRIDDDVDHSRSPRMAGPFYCERILVYLGVYQALFRYGLHILC